MFRTRRIIDDILPLDAREIAQVRTILREQFPLIRPDEITGLPQKLREPSGQRFRPSLFVADNIKGHVNGFALLLYDPILEFCFLDFIAAAQPHPVFDDIDTGARPSRAQMRKIIRAILDGKYAYLCRHLFIASVVASFVDDPVQIRGPKYTKSLVPRPRAAIDKAGRIVLVVNDRHDIHHARERGYVEAPARIKLILKELEPRGFFTRVEPKDYPGSRARAVHDGGFVDSLKKVCESVVPGMSVYLYVFPIRDATRPHREQAVRTGYYCLDRSTPLNENAYFAAKRAVDCILPAATAVMEGARLAYALVRPPGHHTEYRAFGGFRCFNNSAIAAQMMSEQGRVAILDVDHHHGIGQERIFYSRADVLKAAILWHPKFAYPCWSEFEGECGAGAGVGFNMSIAMPDAVDGAKHRLALEQARSRIRSFAPTLLIVSLGLDPAKGDPTGSWSLTADDFAANGRNLADRPEGNCK